MPHRTNATDPALLNQAEKDEQVLALRRRGWAYRRIGSALAMSAANAHRIVKKYLHELAAQNDEETRELRAQECVRLDACLDVIWEQVEQGHLGAIDRVLRLSERRAKLLGLDAPTKIAPTTPDGSAAYQVSDEQLDARIAAAKRIIDGEGGSGGVAGGEG